MDRKKERWELSPRNQLGGAPSMVERQRTCLRSVWYYHREVEVECEVNHSQKDRGF